MFLICIFLLNMFLQVRVRRQYGDEAGCGVRAHQGRLRTLLPEEAGGGGGWGMGARRAGLEIED